MKYTIEQITEKFEYNPLTGDLYCLNYGKAKRKVLLNSISSSGYYRVSTNINKTRMALLVHRIAYELQTKKLLVDEIIDHIDHNKLNNKFNNLRKTSRSENNKNLGKRITNTSGISGVYQLPNGKWRAQIRVNKKNIHLGCFETKEMAAIAKRNANASYNFHINHF